MKSLIDDKIFESNKLRKNDNQIIINEEVVVITTTSSGGAHLSIASVLNNLLSEKQIPHVVVNESELIPEDNLKRFVGIPRKEVYNKVSQQCQRMTYGKNLKKLDDYLNEFVPDQYMNEFRSSIGNSTLLVSTSHHPENIRAVAEHNKRVCFQVCDYGLMPPKLKEVAQIVVKFNLSGILFFVPSERTILNYNEDTLLPLIPKANIKFPRIDRSLNDNPEYLKQLETYQNFAKVMRYPVHQAFTKQLNKLDIRIFKNEQGLREDAKLWVLTMGSQGVGGVLKNYISQIIQGAIQDAKNGIMEKLDVVVLCGSNKSLKKELEEFSVQCLNMSCDKDSELYSQITNLLHFVVKQKISLKEMAEMGKASNAFLSKPGGGTTAEALAGQFPMIIHREEQHFWEFGNIEELKKSGAIEMQKDDNFYEKAKTVSKLKDLNPQLEIYPEENIEYTIELLWKLGRI